VRCSQEASRIQDYISGELGREDRMMLESHLSGCEECKTCAETMLFFRSRLRDLFRVTAPVELRNRIATLSAGGGKS